MRKAKKKKKILNRKAFVIATLRRASYRWPARNEALARARVSRGLYKCEMCGEIFKKKEIQLDHIEPVVPVTGFTTFDDYVERLLCDASGYQVICEREHAVKTLHENLARKILKPAKLFKRKKKKT